jgi:hypothetical protein
VVELPLSNVLPSVYNENGCFDKKKKRSNTERKWEIREREKGRRES